MLRQQPRGSVQTNVQLPNHRFEMLGEQQASRGGSAGLYSRARSEASNRPHSSETAEFKSKTLKNERDIQKLNQRAEHTRAFEKRETVLLQRLRNLENELIKQENDNSKLSKQLARMTDDIQELQREVQENHEESPQLVSMLAKRWRDKMKGEFYDYTNEKTDQVASLIDNEKRLLLEQIRLLEKKVRGNHEREREVSNSQAKEMDAIRETLSYVTKAQKNIQKHAEKNFDKKLKTVTSVVNELKKLMIKKIEFHGMESGNAIEDAKSVALERFKVAQMSVKKVAAELSERMDAQRQRIKDQEASSAEQMARQKRKTYKRLEILQKDIEHMKKTQKKTLLRINKESELTHSVAQYQEKRMSEFFLRLDRYTQKQAINSVMDAIWGNVDAEIQSIELRKEFKRMTSKIPGHLDSMRTDLLDQQKIFEEHASKLNIQGTKLEQQQILIQNHETMMKDQETLLGGLETTMDDHHNRINSGKKALAALEEHVNTQDAALEVRVEAAENKIKEHDDALDELRENVKSHSNDIQDRISKSLQNVVDTVAEQAGSLNDHTQQLSEHAQQLSESNAKITTQEEEIAKNQDLLAKHSNHITSATSDLENLSNSLSFLVEQSDKIADHIDEHTQTLLEHSSTFVNQQNLIQNLADSAKESSAKHEEYLQTHDSHLTMVDTRLNDQAAKITMLIQNDNTDFMNDRLNAHEKQINENGDLLVNHEEQLLSHLDDIQRHDNTSIDLEVRILMNEMINTLEERSSGKHFSTISNFMENTTACFDLLHYQEKQRTRDDVVANLLSDIFSRVNDQINEIEMDKTLEGVTNIQSNANKARQAITKELDDMRDEFNDEMKHHVLTLETSIEHVNASQNKLAERVPQLQEAIEDLAVRTATDQMLIQTQLQVDIEGRISAVESTLTSTMGDKLSKIAQDLKSKEDLQKSLSLVEEKHMATFACEQIITDVVESALHQIEVDDLLQRRADILKVLANI